MTLPQKVLTRLDNIASEILTKINSKVNTHNSSDTAHNDIRTNYVKNEDNYKHSHGQISKDGKITTTTTNVSKVVVTESDGTIKTIQKIPSINVVHQDLSSKLDKNQGVGNSGKFMKVQSTGNIEPEEITIPEIDVRQTKTSGIEIGSVNGTKFYCNENTTYSNATSSVSGLMSSSDKTKLDGITEGADNVTFTRTLNSGTEIGKLRINNDEITLYCSNSTQYGEATQDHAGLMSKQDKAKLDGIAPLADDVSFTRTLTTGTEIGTLNIGNQSTKLYCSTPTTYGVANSGGLAITSDNKFKHSNSIAPKTTSSFSKIQYDAQGHITGSTPVTQSDISDLGIATSNHSHSGWTQIQMDPGERGALYVNEQIKLAAFFWTGGASAGYVNKGSFSLNTIPEAYRPRYRISTHINLNAAKPIVLYIKGRTEASQPGQVWVTSNNDAGKYYFACNLMWTYGF